MKNVIKIVAMVAMALSVSISAEAAKKVELVTSVFVTDIDCEGCKTKIMNVIPFQRGVKSVNVDVPTKVVTIIYDPKKSDDQEIITNFKRIDVIAEVKEGDCSSCSDDSK
ncbi:MAG: heavy-metal-associated domain-containing protein [Rikenellaceae bacterium]